MKKVMILLVLFVGVLSLGACSSKLDKNTQKVIDKMVEKKIEGVNSQLEDEEKKYTYTEKDFSFLIYYDKNQKLYLVDMWEPNKDKPNDMHFKYLVSLDEDKSERFSDDSDFNDYKKSGNYEIVYRSGKFDE